MRQHKIMILNLGSTSFKFKLFAYENNEERVLADGGFESIGSASGDWFIRAGGEKLSGSRKFDNHLDAFQFSMSELSQNRVLESYEELDAIGYKAVHAGTVSGARIVDDETIAILEKYVPYAPAHNPPCVRMMKQVRTAYPNLIQVGCFDTAFHTTIPEKRVTYGVPKFWKEELGVRRYGFHGSSHSYIAWRMQQEHPEHKKVISLHLGGSSSICAIENGKSIASSMGATPQSGIFQNNRVGDFDLFCMPALMEYYEGDWNKILKVLSSESGLYGTSGVSNDLRMIQSAAEQGNADAIMAIEAYVDGIVGYIGMFSAYLKGLEALVFTGGIGKGSKFIQTRVCEELAFLGIDIDKCVGANKGDSKISLNESKVAVYVWQTNEELMVLRQCIKVLQSRECV